MSHSDLVRTLFATLQQGLAGHDAALALFAPDASYWMNAWREPHVGVAAIRTELERQDTEFDDLSSEIVSLVAANNSVFVQRHDSITIGDKALTLHFAGLFTFDAQLKITEWRDWFDSAEIATLMGASSV